MLAIYRIQDSSTFEHCCYTSTGAAKSSLSICRWWNYFPPIRPIFHKRNDRVSSLYAIAIVRANVQASYSTKFKQAISSYFGSERPGHTRQKGRYCVGSNSFNLCSIWKEDAQTIHFHPSTVILLNTLARLNFPNAYDHNQFKYTAKVYLYYINCYNTFACYIDAITASSFSNSLSWVFLSYFNWGIHNTSGDILTLTFDNLYLPNWVSSFFNSILGSCYLSI